MTKKQRILEFAVEMAESVGIQGLSRNPLAEALGIANGSVSYHFGAIENLRDAVVRHAIETENLIIIAKALGEAHPLAREVSCDLKKRALKTLLE